MTDILKKIIEVGKDIAVIGAWITPIGFFIYNKWIKKWLKNYKIEKNAWRDQISKEIKEIKMQVYPNGGSSLNDKITEGNKQFAIILASIIDIKFGQRITWESLKMAMWESDADGKVTYASPEACDLIGCSQEDVMDNSWVSKIAPEDRKRIVEAWIFCVNNASEFKEEYSFIRPDGSRQKVLSQTTHMKDTEGKVIISKGWSKAIGPPYKL